MIFFHHAVEPVREYISNREYISDYYAIYTWRHSKVNLSCFFPFPLIFDGNPMYYHSEYMCMFLG